MGVHKLAGGRIVISDEITKIAEPNTELNVPEKASKVREVLAINETNLISLSDFNISEEYSRVKEMRTLDGKNDVQQEENSNKDSKRMDHDYTNVDLIVEDNGTDEPTVKTSKGIPRKGINDEALTKAEEGLNPNSKESTLEERFKSEKDIGIGDTTRDGVTVSKASDTSVEIKDTEEEYGSEPDLSHGKTNRVSIRTETFDPIEVVNEVDTIKSTSLTSLEVDDPRTVDNNTKSVNNDIHCSR